jgi:phage terminase small subunit
MPKTAQVVEERKALSPQNPVHQRRSRFIKEFLIDQNASRAAIAAGYSPKSAHVTGSRLLNDVKVRRAIEIRNARLNEKADVTVERVKLELARLAFYDPLAYWNEDGTAKPLHEIGEDARRAIAGLDVAELFTGNGEDRGLAGYIKKFKLADKGAALERLGRHLQMFPTKVEISGEIGVRTYEDGDIDQRIKALERDLGLAAQIDAAGRVAIAAAGEGTQGKPQEDTPVLSRQRPVKA